MRLKKERRTPPRKARWRCTEHATRPGSCDVRTACPLATSWKETSKGLSAVGSVREPLLQRAGVPQRVRRELCVELALGGKAEVHVDFRSIHARSSDAVVSVCLCARVYPECVCCLGASFTCVSAVWVRVSHVSRYSCQPDSPSWGAGGPDLPVVILIFPDLSVYVDFLSCIYYTKLR